MSDDGKFVGDSLEDLLVSLADGVREAQQELRSSPAVDEYGRLLESYHFPYVDFEFDISMETANSSAPGRTLLRIKPASSTQRKTEIKSSISGRLVAVPPGQGVPRPIVSFSSTQDSALRWSIQLNASNDAGEVLAGHTLELNLNLLASQQLSAANGVTLDEFPTGTTLETAVLTTDAAGNASTRLALGPGVKDDTLIVITAELLGESHNHTIGVS